MHWFTANWFNIVQTVSLVVTLAIAVSALRSSERATKGSNSLAITTNHREIWSQLIANPELQNISRPTMAPGEKIRDDERHFILEVIHHGAASFELAQMGGVNPQQGLRRDIYETLKWPVFRAVWDETKIYQDADFVEFMESCIAGIDLDKPVGRRPVLIQRIAKKVVSRSLAVLPSQLSIEDVEGSSEERTAEDSGSEG
jgi:hypothetical protein